MHFIFEETFVYNPGSTTYFCSYTIPKQGVQNLKVTKHLDGRYAVLNKEDKKVHSMIESAAISALKDFLAALYVQSDY